VVATTTYIDNTISKVIENCVYVCFLGEKEEKKGKGKKKRFEIGE
jgi:hypothetical protein